MVRLKLMLLLVMLGMAAQAQLALPVELKPGMQLPDFTIEQMDGEKTGILALAARSKYTLIDIWASWCQPCRRAFPILKAVHAGYAGTDFNIIGVSIDRDEIAWKVALVEEDPRWQHGRDLNSAILKHFGIVGIPAYLLIDAKGKLVSASVVKDTGTLQFGPGLEETELEATLKKLLN